MISDKHSKSSRHRVICRGREVPEGWVVIEVGHNQACPGEGHNSLVIKRPGKREVVCECSPIPEGYRKLRRTKSGSCPGESDNAWVIEVQGDTK